MLRQIILMALILLCCVESALAVTRYRITSHDGDKVVEYQVSFGGAKLFEQWTAFDPASKTFVYLSFTRGAEPPKPTATIWDHRTGETIPLYKFPDVEQPLPVIPSLGGMKVCPLTGDKKFKAETYMFLD